ncbi:MAG: esterase [Burkholderiaceae bacterium]|nr:MAG: esterase [Burkholderiaceae bacterium]
MNSPLHALRRVALAAAVGLTALIASCGGGTPVVAFQPTRVLAFGDENSVITADARKYTVNALVADTNGVKSIACASNPLWVQRLASSYGLVFPECNPDAVANPASRIYAANGAKVADLVAQVDQHLAADTFSEKDLVTLFVGQNDVLEQYALYPNTPSDQLLAAAYTAGAVLAGQVSRIADAGGKVLVSTAPELALTPYARAEDTAAGDTSRSTLLSALVAKFNEGLRVGISKLNGSQVAIMLTNELMQTMYKFPASYGGMSNVLDKACDATLAPAVLQCTSDTLVTGATSTTHLWADAIHLSPNGHNYVGALAANRTRTNPF